MGVPRWLRTPVPDQRGQFAGYKLVLAGLILLALGLRLARLGFQPLWWDEGWSLYFATTDMATMLERTAVDIHPPLYYLLLHAWMQVLGKGVLSIRLLSVAIGTATVPLVFAVGRRLLGRSGGLLAAFLLAISPFHIYYSQEVRMYGLVTLLGLSAFYFALRWQRAVPRAENGQAGAGQITRTAADSHRALWSLVAYTLSATAALYTQYYAAFLLLSLNLVVAVGWARRRRPVRELAAWLGAQVGVALLFLPWALYAGGKLVTYVQFKVGVEQDPSLGFLAYVAHHLSAFTWGHGEGTLAGLWWIGLIPLVVLLLALGLLFWRRISAERALRPGGWLWALAVFAIMILCGFAVNLVLPFNPPRSERLLLLALPAYLLLLAGALLALWRQRRALAVGPALSFLVVAALSLAAFYGVVRYPLDDYHPVAERIRGLGSATDAIVCVHPWQVGYFQAYIPDDDARPALILTPRRVLPSELQLWASDPALMASDLGALLEEHGRLWFPAHQAMGRILEDRIAIYLAEQAYPVLNEWYAENTVLSFYTSGDEAAGPSESCAGQCPGARFGSWLVLEEAAFKPGPLEAGRGIVPIDLVWRALEPAPGIYHVGLRLVGTTDHVWAQRDAPPFGGLDPSPEWPVGEPQLDRHGLLVPAGTPPGEYRLMLRVYRAQDVEVLPVVFEGGSGGELELGTVRVTRPADPPPVEALVFQQELEASFGPLQLQGYNIYGAGPLLPGQAVEVELFWLVPNDPAEDFLPRLQLLAANEELVAELVEKPVAGTYPTAWWQAGELVRDPHALVIPAAADPGRARLVLSLIRAAGGQAVPMRGGRTYVELGEIEVVGREHRFGSTAPEHRQGASFGPAIELTGYDLSGATASPGSYLEVRLHWHAADTPEANYRSFVHLLNAEGEILAQHDGTPGEGGLPTLGWLPGEYVVDAHSMYVPAGLPPGEYRLAVGLYDPVSKLGPGERVVLDTPVRVRDGP
jgi:4-amino-4-deoxy-L-arabinose transferase-like glycosyltransferase